MISAQINNWVYVWPNYIRPGAWGIPTIPLTPFPNLDDPTAAGRWTPLPEPEISSNVPECQGGKMPTLGGIVNINQYGNTLYMKVFARYKAEKIRFLYDKTTGTVPGTTTVLQNEFIEFPNNWIAPYENGSIFPPGAWRFSANGFPEYWKLGEVDSYGFVNQFFRNTRNGITFEAWNPCYDILAPYFDWHVEDFPQQYWCETYIEQWQYADLQCSYIDYTPPPMPEILGGYIPFVPIFGGGLGLPGGLPGLLSFPQQTMNMIANLLINLRGAGRKDERHERH